MSSSDAESRFHSLDALRAGALLLGIALHATMSFLPGFRAAGWPIVDDSQSQALSAVYFVMHIFRMTVFFLIAGFFARLLYRRLGMKGFVRQRLRRIALPLLAAMVVVMPLTIVPLAAAVRLHAQPGTGAAALLRPQGGVPWGHLWFLYLLLVLYALGILMRALLITLDRDGHLPKLADRVMRGLVHSRLAPVVLAAPLCLALYFMPSWLAWEGIPLPIMGFIPNFPAVLTFGGAMCVGWLLHRQLALLEQLARDWPVYLAAAAATSSAAWMLIGPDAQLRLVALEPGTRLAYASSYTVAIWCWSLGLTGIAVAFRSKEAPAWRYLAEASYWMYLTHIPLVWGLQVLMMKWPLPWGVKYPLLLAVTVAVLLFLYHFLVRGTFVGVFLNGRRLPEDRGRRAARGRAGAEDGAPQL